MQRDLDALAARRAPLSETVKAWLDDRPQERLAHAAALARARGRERLLGGEAGTFPELADWYDRANRVRAQLDTPLKADLLLGGLLAGWRGVE